MIIETLRNKWWKQKLWTKYRYMWIPDFMNFMNHLVRHSSVHCHALLLHVIQVGLGDWHAEVDDWGVLYRRFRFVRRFTGRVTVGFLCGRHVHSLLAVWAGHQKPGDGLPRQKCVCFCNLITERNTSCYEFFKIRNRVYKVLRIAKSYISINLKIVVFVG